MKRVLYVDDSQMALRMMERMLRDVVEVRCVATLRDAEAILAEEPPMDLIITDYLMDDGNGISFARRLRADPRYRNVPILLVSAAMTNEVAYEAMRVGVNKSFRKPLRPAEVRDVVIRQLESPWIEEAKRSRLHLHGVSWVKDGVYFEYSPDLNRYVSAATREEAHREMLEQLKERVGGRMDFEEVVEFHLVEYDLDVE